MMENQKKNSNNNKIKHRDLFFFFLKKFEKLRDLLLWHCNLKNIYTN